MGVHRAHAHGKRVPAGGSGGLERPSLLQVRPHDPDGVDELACVERPPLPGLREPVFVPELRLDRSVLRVAEVAAHAPRALTVDEGRLLKEVVSPLLEHAAHAEAPRLPALPTPRSSVGARPADFRKRALALPRAQAERPPVDRGHRPVLLDFSRHCRRRYAHPPREALPHRQAFLNLCPVRYGQMLVFILRHVRPPSCAREYKR